MSKIRHGETKYPMTKNMVLCRWWWRAPFLCAAAALLAIPAAAFAQAPALAPNYWQQRLFFVPYQVNRQDPAFQHVAKVQLLLSRDGVTDWRVLEEARPNVQGFSFLAPEDGEYWFALRHLDGRGQPWPAAAVVPQMRVVVDTIKPMLELSARVDAAGAVVVRYDARDANLRPESVTVEVRPAGGTWSALALGAPDETHIDRSLGRATWTPPAGTKSVEIRATVLDKSGHRAEANTTVSLSVQQPRPNELPADMAGRPLPLPPIAASQDWPADNRLPENRRGLDSAAADDCPLPKNGSRTGSKPASPQTVAGGTLQPPPETNPYSDPPAPQDSNRTPARLVGDGPADVNATRSAPSELPAAEPDASDGGIRSVNSKTFDVEYDLDSSGPWGVAKVELWGTADNSRTWSSFAVDDDNRSPLRVTVPREGKYGFRIVVDGGNAGSSAPASGDQPELVVAIDCTPPRVEKFSAELGNGDLVGHMLFHWSASDANLQSHPISLFYSSFPSGPWTSIAAGVENSGSYTWRLERHVPDRFYLKLEARDMAGNVGAHQLSTPIRLERPKATGRLRGVRPVQEQGS